MTPLSIALNLALSFAGLAALCLAMDRHHRAIAEDEAPVARPAEASDAGSAPMADSCTKCVTPRSAEMRAMRPAASWWTASKVFFFSPTRMPTQLMTASASIIAAVTDRSSRTLQGTGSTWPTAP